MFRRSISPLSSGKISQITNQRKRRWQVDLLAALVSSSDYSSTLKIEEIYSSETSVDIQWITLRYIPEERSLQGNKIMIF
jgi:hypothetical protein